MASSDFRSREITSRRLRRFPLAPHKTEAVFMTGEPIIFYNFALPSVHPMLLPCYYVGLTLPLSFSSPPPSLSLSNTYAAISRFPPSEARSRDTDTQPLYVEDDREEISGTSFADRQIRLVLMAEKSIITTCISRRGSKGFGNDFLADVFPGETECRSERFPDTTVIVTFPACSLRRPALLITRK